MLPPPSDSRLAIHGEQWFVRARAALLGAVPCRKSCSRCCIGPFAITVLDADAIQRGLLTLPEPIRRDIVGRARLQADEFARAFPRLHEAPFVDEWPDEHMDQLAAQFADRPCPALDDGGACRIYPFRPLACRTMGIPIESNGLVTGACEVQTSVPLIRLSPTLREQEEALAGQEAAALAARCSTDSWRGTELWLASGFIRDRPPG